MPTTLTASYKPHEPFHQALIMNDDELEAILDENYTAADIDIEQCLDIGDGIYVVSLIPEVPVEYCGVVSDQCFYFKSRGQRWQFTLGASLHHCTNDTLQSDNNNIVFQCAGKIPGKDFEASYMATDLAEEIIRNAVQLWQLSLTDVEEEKAEEGTVYVPFHIEPLNK